MNCEVAAVEPRYNEPLHNEVIGIYNERFSSTRVIVRYVLTYEKEPR